MTENSRDAERSLIRKNIEDHGFHSYTVTGGGFPHYYYTIGLQESIGAELILAGAYYYRIQDVPDLVRQIVQQIEGRIDWSLQTCDLEASGVFSFSNVHPSWKKMLMLGVFSYYEKEHFSAYQIVPGEAQRTLEIPNLATPYDPALEPAWRWLTETWDYPVPMVSCGLTDLAALRGARITEVMRWETDQWELFSCPEPDVMEAERRIVPLAMLLSIDLSLEPILSLPVGKGFWRDSLSDWHPWG